MEVRRTLGHELDPFHFPLCGLAGVALALAFADAALALETPSEDKWGGVIGQCLVVAGLLVVPVSVFPAVVGAMFPNYWNATPATLVEGGPVLNLLRFLVVLLAYTLTSLLLPPTAVIAVPLVVGVGIGVTWAIRVVAISFALLNPLEAERMLQHGAVHEKDIDRARQHFGDLCRLVRGMRQRGRLEVVVAGIGLIQSAWEQRRKDIGDAAFARQVVDECKSHWATRARLVKAADDCIGALDLKDEGSVQLPAK